jgi:hypothetical protein
VQRGEGRRRGVLGVGARLVEQRLGVVVSVEELKRRDLFGELLGSGQTSEFPVAGQCVPVPGLVPGGLARGVQRHGESVRIAGCSRVFEGSGGFASRVFAGLQTRAGQGTCCLEACSHDGIESVGCQCRFHAREQFTEPAALPQRASSLSLDRAGEVRVVNAREDRIGDGDGLVRPLSAA